MNETGTNQLEQNGNEPESSDRLEYANRKYCRKRSGKMIAGVCSGAAVYMGLPVAAVRAVFVFLIFFGGIGAFLYGALVLLFPYSGQSISESTVSRMDLVIKPLAIAFAAILIFYSFFDFFSFNAITMFSLFSKSFILGISLAVIGVFLYRSHGNEHPDRDKNEDFILGSSGIFLGVCEGLANYFSADASIIRIIWLTFTVITLGTGLLIYLLIFLSLKGRE